MNAGRRKRVLVALGTAAVLLLACEAFFRALESRLIADAAGFEELRQYVVEGRPSTYFEARPYTVFARQRNLELTEMVTNSLGFIDSEWSVEKTPGVPRIVCLGSSTTEGGHGPRLEEILRRRTGRDFDVMNAAIAGWTSAEVLVSWFLTVQDFRPDLVVIHEGINDVDPRAWPDFRSDYTHYRHPWRAPRFNPLHRFLVRSSHLYSWLFLRGSAPNIGQFTTYPVRSYRIDEQGKLPPETVFAYRRNLETIGMDAALQGASVLLMTMPLRPPIDEAHAKRFAAFYSGVAEHNQIMRELANEHGWLLVDAERSFAEKERVFANQFTDLCHLKPVGSRYKAELIAEALIERWLPGLPAGQ